MNTYSQVYIMFVWGVKYRLGLISKQWEKELWSVIGSLSKDIDCHPVAIGGIRDHVHVLLSLGNDAPSCKEIAKYLKSKSSKWVNENHLCMGKFAWQEGSGRFSYIKRDIDMLINYIKNQERHHLKCTYREEFAALLDRLSIPYDDRYLPSEPE